MAVQRDGFKDGTHAKSSKPDMASTASDDQLKGDSNANAIDGLAGDDVIIGYSGNDTVEGGLGEDDLSGSAGDDKLIGGVWEDDGDGAVEIGSWTFFDGDEITTFDTWTFDREFTQDTSADDYVGESSFAANGTDTIYGYDETMDIVEVDALQAGYDALDLADDALLNGSVTAADLETAGYITYDATTGDLKIDLDGNGDSLDTWFVVLEDSSSIADGTVVTSNPNPAPTWDAAESVTVEIGDALFTFI